MKTGLHPESFELALTLLSPIAKRNSGLIFVATEEIGSVAAITEARFSGGELGRKCSSPALTPRKLQDRGASGEVLLRRFAWPRCHLRKP